MTVKWEIIPLHIHFGASRDGLCLFGWITHARRYRAHLGESSPRSKNESGIQSLWCWGKPTFAPPARCLRGVSVHVESRNVSLGVREWETSGQKSSTGQHLQSAIPRRSVCTSTLSCHSERSGCAVRLTPSQRGKGGSGKIQKQKRQAKNTPPESCDGILSVIRG